MKTYWRLLAMAGPLSAPMSRYLLLTLLGIVFGVANFTLLIPLLDLIFWAAGDSVSSAGVAISSASKAPTFPE
ncbi:MAG: ABC transporter ATP-binding protein, partial [Bacteroidota bacterium]